MSARLSPRDAGKRARKQVWMSQNLIDLVEALAEDEDSDFSELTRQALIALLRERGRWPGVQPA